MSIKWLKNLVFLYFKKNKMFFLYLYRKNIHSTQYTQYSINKDQMAKGVIIDRSEIFSAT